MLNQQQLSRTLLPLGTYTKSDIRQIAEENKLPSASVKDSQDLCFLGERTYTEFLRNYIPDAYVKGPIKNTAGEIIGEHNGLIHYTYGQRKGIRIAAPEPYYVIKKISEENTLVVGTIDELGNRLFSVRDFNWIIDEQSQPLDCEVKIRYKSKAAPAVFRPESPTEGMIELKRPLSAITPGQVAVCYHGDEVLGAGIIRSIEK